MLFVAAGIAIVAVVVAGLYAAFGRASSSGEKQVASLMAAAGCNFKTVAAYVPPGQGVHVPA